MPESMQKRIKADIIQQILVYYGKLLKLQQLIKAVASICNKFHPNATTGFEFYNSSSDYISMSQMCVCVWVCVYTHKHGTVTDEFTATC